MDRSASNRPIRPTADLPWQSRALIALIGLVPAAIGFLVLLGWALENEGLVATFPTVPLMVVNTALTVTLLGVGVAISAIGPRSALAGAGLGLGVVLLTDLTLFEYVTGFDLGIDNLWIEPFTTTGQDVLGRMSPYTAITLCMLGLSLVILGCPPLYRRVRGASGTLATLAGTVALGVLVGYAAGYRLPLAGTMSIRTAVSVVFLSVAIFGQATLMKQESLSLSSWLLRHAMIMVMLMPVLLWQGLSLRRESTGEITAQNLGDLLGVGTLLFAAATAIAVHYAYNERTLKIAQLQLANDLEQLNTQLEQRVADRTSELNESHLRLQAMSHQLAISEQRERQRLAVEMHDYLTQLLVTARIHNTLARKSNQQDEVRVLLDKVDSLLNDSIGYSRHLIADLSPTVLFDFGLVAALNWLADQMGGHGLAVDVEDHCGDSFKVREEPGILLYQVTRELLYNVLRHAGVERATLRIDAEEDRFIIQVIDRGKGFDVGTLMHKHTARDGSRFGLFNLRQRMAAAGGEVEFESAPGKGTSVTLSMPIDKIHAAEDAPAAPHGEPETKKS